MKNFITTKSIVTISIVTISMASVLVALTSLAALNPIAEPPTQDAGQAYLDNRQELLAFATAVPEPTAQPTTVPTKGDGSALSSPLPHGVKFEAGVFDMQITGVDRDAWPEIQAENSSNDAPAPGYGFTMWTISVENARSETEYAELITESKFYLIGSYGVVYRPLGLNGCGIIPDELFGLLHLGDKTEGNVCFAVPAGETDLTFLYHDSHYDSGHSESHGYYIEASSWFRAEEPSGGPAPTLEIFTFATANCTGSEALERAFGSREMQASDVDGYIPEYGIEITTSGQLLLYIHNTHTVGCDSLIISQDRKTLKRTNGTVVQDRYSYSCSVHLGELWDKMTYARDKYDFDLPRTDLDTEPIDQHPLTAMGKQVCAGTLPPPDNRIQLTF